MGCYYLCSCPCPCRAVLMHLVLWLNPASCLLCLALLALQAALRPHGSSADSQQHAGPIWHVWNCEGSKDCAALHRTLARPHQQPSSQQPPLQAATAAAHKRGLSMGHIMCGHDDLSSWQRRHLCCSALSTGLLLDCSAF
jgi:hypothetical protein